MFAKKNLLNSGLQILAGLVSVIVVMIWQAGLICDTQTLYRS